MRSMTNTLTILFAMSLLIVFSMCLSFDAALAEEIELPVTGTDQVRTAKTLMLSSGEHVQLDGLFNAETGMPVFEDVSSVFRFTVENGMAYLLTGGGVGFQEYDAGLALVNVSDPYSPDLVSFAEVSHAGGTDVAVRNDFAYVTEYLGDALYVINMHAPEGPDVVDVFELNQSHRQLYGLAIDENVLYVDDGDYLWSINIADPWNLELICPSERQDDEETSNFRRESSILVKEDEAYLWSPMGMVVVDIEDPEYMPSITSYRAGEFEHGLGFDLEGDYIYGSAGYHGVNTVDVSDPTSPNSLNTTNTPRYFSAVAAAGDQLYVADPFNRIYVYDIEELRNPGLIRTVDLAQDNPRDNHAAGLGRLEVHGDLLVGAKLAQTEFYNWGYRGLVHIFSIED
ncbi:LVIVD repeat-containing protein, partial [Calditrichota bacterium]